MNKRRCEWAGSGPLYLKYHDEEWGKPLHDDRRLFELLVLEGAQAGLSWLTVLRKRGNYREAFDRFDAKKVASYDSKKIKRLLSNAGIIRNRLKIESAVGNAKAFLKVQKEFGSFDSYLWGFVSHRPVQNHFKNLKQIPPRTPASDAMSADLKNRGFRFVGSTIAYAFMQAAGLVNDHVVSCFRYHHLIEAREF